MKSSYLKNNLYILKLLLGISKGRVNTMLFDKATEVELACYEDTEFYNQFTFAMKDCHLRIAEILENMSLIFASVIAVFSLYYMFLIDHCVIIFILGPIIGNFVFGKLINEMKFRQKKESIPYTRKMDYVNRSIYLADQAIKKAWGDSGFQERLDTLEEGIETKLTREFDEAGINLSGGEAQKVAIARTFYKYCPIIILDEPSSALDPISEYKLNEVMMQAAANKAVIFISHRLSSTIMADRIYMFEKGRIIEQGSHEELMKLGGKYAEMFHLQAEKYCS